MMDLDTSLPLQPCSRAEIINMTKDSKATDLPISSEEVETLRTENASLKSQLREAREMIRNLELQVEAQRVNARKAAQALIDAAS